MQPYSSRRIYEGRVLNLRVDEIDKRGGGRRTIEVVEHRGGAIIIARPSPSEIVMVRQHRYAVDADLWELPAGMIDPGEAPQAAAIRELHEETGYTAAQMRYLWSAYATPGFCQELWRFFVAEDLTPGVQRPDEDEEIEVRTWPIEEAWKLVEADQLRDGKTQIGLAWALRKSCEPARDQRDKNKILKNESKRVMEEIHRVLLTVWDPIGVGDVPEAEDEYDSYGGALFGLLMTGATDREIAEHLGRLVTIRMELPASTDAMYPTVAELRKIALPGQSV